MYAPRLLFPKFLMGFVPIDPMNGENCARFFRPRFMLYYNVLYLMNFVGEITHLLPSVQIVRQH